MTTVTCPNGHASTSSDYCDTCGVPISGAAPDAGPGGVVPAPDAGSPDPGPPGTGSPSTGAGPATVVAQPQTCPNCSAENSATALFCEACGYDFTTGTMPRPPDPVQVSGGETGEAPAPPAAAGAGSLATPTVAEWVVELWVDPDWYAEQGSDDPCPSPGLPVVVPLRLQSVLVGRPSASRNIHPDVDCSSDSGVSRRQAQLTSDGQRWWVEDLQSSNGTYVGPASGPLPATPIPPGQRHELGEDDRVYIGTWTRLVVRRATPEERGDQPA